MTVTGIRQHAYKIYILGVFTEKPYNETLERNVIYIPIMASSHATSVMSK